MSTRHRVGALHICSLRVAANTGCAAVRLRAGTRALLANDDKPAQTEWLRLGCLRHRSCLIASTLILNAHQAQMTRWHMRCPHPTGWQLLGCPRQQVRRELHTLIHTKQRPVRLAVLAVKYKHGNGPTAQKTASMSFNTGGADGDLYNVLSQSGGGRGKGDEHLRRCSLPACSAALPRPTAPREAPPSSLAPAILHPHSADRCVSSRV